MADHKKFLALATRLIAKHGRMVGFLKLREGAADPARPWGKGPATAPQDLGKYKGVMVPFKGNDFGKEWQDFDLTKYADNILLVAGVPGVKLEEAHLLVDDSINHKIEWVQVLRPGDLTILYAFGVNR